MPSAWRMQLDVALDLAMLLTVTHNFLRVVVNGLSCERNETARVVGLVYSGDGVW